MGPRMKRSSPSAVRQSVLSFATVEEAEAGSSSKYNVSDVVTLTGRPMSRVQSAPVLTSHEILAGYESMTRNKSLELCPPDRPPPPVPEWANRAPKPLPPPKPIALRSYSTPIPQPLARPGAESSENVLQAPSPSEYVSLVVPVQAKEVADVIGPAANLPQRTPTPEKLPTIEKPRARKSYRHSFSIRFRRLMPKHRSEKRLTKAPTSNTIATADTTTQPDLESFFKPSSKPQDSEKDLPIPQIVQERGPDEIQVVPNGSTNSTHIPARQREPSLTASDINLSNSNHNYTDALVVRLPKRADSLHQACSIPPAPTCCPENFDAHSPTSPISAHANLCGVEDISKISSAYCHPPAITIPMLEEYPSDPINILAAVLKSGLNPVSSKASDSSPAIISRDFAMADPTPTSRVSPKASPRIPSRPSRYKKRLSVPDTALVSEASSSTVQMPARSLEPSTFEQSPAPAVVSTTSPSISPTRDQIPAPGVTSTSQPPSVASPSENIYFVHPIKSSNSNLSNRNTPLDQRKWQRLPKNTEGRGLQRSLPPDTDLHNLNNLATRHASLGGPQAANWGAVKSGVKTNRVEFYQPEGIIVWTPPSNSGRPEERVWA